MKIGFIGMGNMGQAMATGFIRSGRINPAEIYAYAPNQEKLQANAAKLGFVPCGDVMDTIEGSVMVIMACKPYQIEGVLAKVAPALSGKLLVSIASGWTYDRYMEILGGDVKVQYIMPNTPVSIGQGVLLMEETSNLFLEEREDVRNLFSALGKVVTVPTKLMTAGMAVSGCGPAFIDMVIEGLGDGAVKNGLSRDLAYELVCQTMIGSAALMVETGEHPGKLKDNVCSPGGDTIKGVAALEEAGIRSAFIKAIDAILNK